MPRAMVVRMSSSARLARCVSRAKSMPRVAVRIAKDHVGVPLDDGELPNLCNAVADDIEGVKRVAFGIQPRFRGIYVFGGVFIRETRQYTSSESNRAPLRVADWKNHAAFEAV